MKYSVPSFIPSRSAGQCRLRSALFCTCLIFSAVFIFASCSPSLSIALASDGRLDCSFEASLSAPIADTVRSFGNIPAGTALFDAALISSSLKRAGFTDAAAVSPSVSALSVKAAVKSISELLPGISGAVVYEAASGGKLGSLSLCVSPDILEQVLALLPAETMDYIDLLSAPVFTGERMSADEYIDLIGAVYGKTVANELKKGVLTVWVRVPGTAVSAVSSVKTSAIVKDGNTARFNVPLADFLAQSEKIEFCVRF